jgi:hypothetical protein
MIKQKTKTQLAFNISQREIKELYCPISSDESQIKEVSIDLFEHFDFSPEKFKTLQGNDKTLPYLINYIESDELPLSQKLARRI